MRTRLVCAAAFASVIGQALPGIAQIDQERAQAFFKEAQALCEGDGGRLWGVSLCGPMVMGDARTRTFATSQAAPDAPRSPLVGLINAPVQWGGATWASYVWDTLASAPSQPRNEVLIHELFHVVQPRLGLMVTNPASEHLDGQDGRYWMRLEWRALARALRESGPRRSNAVRDALAFRQARHTRLPGAAENERASLIVEGLASYTGTVVAAASPADAIAGALRRLTELDSDVSFVRTFAYTSGPAYGVLLDAASPGWRQKLRGTDDLAVLLMGALAVQPAADAPAEAARYGGPELLAAERQREQQREARLADLRQRFVDGPVLVIRGGGSGTSNSAGAIAIPGSGTIFFGAFRFTGRPGSLVAETGVLVSSDGGTRTVAGPVRQDDRTLTGDGWTFTATPGWVIREGARRGDYEVVQQQP
jgi:hypothetical protein